MPDRIQTEKPRLLQAVKRELGFFDAGGYGRPFRGQWRPTLLLRDSPVCINCNDAGRQSPCSQCPLFSLVPPDKHSSVVPCHHIPLNKKGVTIAKLYAGSSQPCLDSHYRNWLEHIINALKTSF